MVSKYFFWIEDGNVEIYKDGKLEKFSGEESYSYIEDIQGFWKKWEENAGFIPGKHSVNFTFIGPVQKEIEEFESYPKKNYLFSKEEDVSFEDVKIVFERRDKERFLIKANEKIVCMERCWNNYNRIPKTKDCLEIYVIGDNVNDNFFDSENMSLDTVDRSRKRGKFVTFCEKKIKC